MEASPINELPHEMLVHIFSRVGDEDVFVLLWVCKKWRKLCKMVKIEKEVTLHDSNRVKVNLKLFEILINFRITALSLCGGYSMVSDDILTKIGMKCPELTSLYLNSNLGYPSIVTDNGITDIAKGCPQLEILELFFCREVTDDGITTIGENCSQLRKLDISWCSQVTDVGISKIGEGCPKLRVLNLEECKVTDVGITKIAEGCSQLRDINLEDCDEVTDAGISKIAEGCPYLEAIRFGITFSKKRVLELSRIIPQGCSIYHRVPRLNFIALHQD